MIACPSCATQIPDQSMVCKFCGHELKPGAARILDLILDSIAGAAKDVAERHLRTQASLRVLFAPTRPGQGPLRMEDWDKWTQDQRKAYAELRAEADLPPKDK
jgi:hypothetical protein